VYKIERGGLVQASEGTRPPGLVLTAIATRKRFKIAYWDAAIIEAARSLHCEVVLSEDLGDGQDYGGVRVEDRFRAADTS
jgi:predicted nucleic acid-binding protein